MKIVCPTCGKKYNYEKQMGVCPSCKKYTSYIEVQKQNQDMAPKKSGLIIDDEYSQEFLHDKNSPEYHGDDNDATEQVYFDYDTAENYSYEDTGAYGEEHIAEPAPNSSYQTSPYFSAMAVRKKITPINMILSVIIFIIMFSLFLGTMFNFIPNMINETKEVNVIEEVEPGSFQVGEIITLADDRFFIDQPYILDSQEYEPPEGWKYVCFPYHIDTSMDSLSIDYDRPYSYTDVYLKIEKSFIIPVTEYDLPYQTFEQTIIKDRMKALNPMEGIESYGNNIVFLIPADQMEYSLSIYEYEADSNYNIDKLIQIMELAIAEEDIESEDTSVDGDETSADTSVEEE